MTSVRSILSFVAIPAIGLLCHEGFAQHSEPISLVDRCGATVRLEAHEKPAEFKLGDLITLDLIFTVKAPGCAVFMDGNRLNAPQDLVNITPTDGWLRFVGSQVGGSPEDLGNGPVRIPIVINRSIVFQQPGHYEITITTSRLHPSSTGITPGTQCCVPLASQTTNAVGIDILPRDVREESALVAELTRQIEEKPQPFLSDDWKKQHAPLMREMDGLEKTLKRSPLALDPQQTEKVMRQFNAAVNEEKARIDKEAELRREAAIRLSYLSGDDAVRAKVRWILADEEDGSGEGTGLAMLNGLAHSRNLELQRQLLQAAWEDTGRVPTGLLQSALQQTKAFLQNETFELYYSHGVPGRTLPHTVAVEEYQRELSQVLATLPQRSGINREHTTYYLLMSGHGFARADVLRLRTEIEADFAGMNPGMQTNLLRMRWNELCDPSFTPPSEPLKSSCASTRPAEGEAPTK